jgi:hypothetical protein
MQNIGWHSAGGVLQNHEGEQLRDQEIAKRTTLGSWEPVSWAIPTSSEPQTPGTRHLSEHMQKLVSDTTPNLNGGEAQQLKKLML